MAPLEEARALISEDRKAGGHLQLRSAPEDSKDGPWRLVGSDSKGRRMKVYGSEALIVKTLHAQLDPEPLTAMRPATA